MAGSYILIDRVTKVFSSSKQSGDYEINEHQNSIVFVESRIDDDYTEELRKRYEPLNPSSSKRDMSLPPPKTKITDSQLPSPQFNIFNPSRLCYTWKTQRKTGPGLNNPHNTCFMNSVLQILSYTPPLWQYLTENKSDAECRAGPFCAECSLRRLFGEMLSSDDPVWPTYIAHNIRLIGDHLRVGHQEDAHEFLISLLQSLKKHYKIEEKGLDRYTRETHLANHVFGGWFRGSVKCLECGYESIMFDPMLEINLDIEKCEDINSALQLFCSPDPISGQQYFCSECKCKVAASKTVSIQDPPRFLTLHLKRFRFQNNKFSKNSKFVSFSDKLDITPFMYHPSSSVEYRLYGIIVHIGGGTNFGHYVAYAKSPLDVWFRLNDSSVTSVGTSKVLSESAYLLFYAREDFHGAPKRSLLEDRCIVSHDDAISDNIPDGDSPRKKNRKNSVNINDSQVVLNSHPTTQTHETCPQENFEFVKKSQQKQQSEYSHQSNMSSVNNKLNALDRHIKKSFTKKNKSCSNFEHDRRKKRKSSHAHKFPKFMHRSNPFQFMSQRIIEPKGA